VRIDAAASEDRRHRHQDRRGIVVAAHLGDKAPVRLERAPHPRQHRLGRVHPVQGGVGKYRVELLLEGEALARHDARVDAAGPRRRNHVGRGVDRDHLGPGGDDLLGQDAVAAAEIEDALARLGIEQFEHRRAEGRHEIRRRRVAPGLPVLPGDAHQAAPAASA